MGIAVVCDRCGDFAKWPHSTAWKLLDTGEPNVQDPAGIRGKILLCPKCDCAFKEFMRDEANRG